MSDLPRHIEQYVFVQIGEDDASGVVSSIKLHSGMSNPYPAGFDDGNWDNFLPVAGFLGISPLTESNRTSANGFQIVLRFPPEDETPADHQNDRENLIKLSHALDVADWPVCVWLLELAPEDCEKMWAGDYSSAPKPKPVIVGQLGTPTVSPEKITFSCYTAGQLLDRAYGVPVIWNDFQQNQLNPLIRNDNGDLVDPAKGEDGAFQFADRSFAELGVEFP